MRLAALVVAAGRGLRAGGGVPKQFRPLAGATATRHALRAFRAHPRVDTCAVVLHPDDMAQAHSLCPEGAETVAGGATRSASVRAGLEALEGRFDAVLIHDAARPCVRPSIIDGVIDALATHAAAAPALAVTDALWTGTDGCVTGSLSRDGVFRAQTPQGFDLAAILAAHRRFPDGADDDVSIARRAGITVAITQGDEDNMKITTPADFARAARILEAENGH